MSLPPPRAPALAAAGQRFPHLWTGLLAALTTVLALVALDRVAQARIGAQAARLADLNLPEYARGMALQREIVRWPHCLPVYGSSELSMYQPTRADLYFRDHPSGFRVVVIGHGGDRCLLMLQELAALGPDACGRKFVVFLSPNWFVAPTDQHVKERVRRQFVKEFSPSQAGSLLLDRRLDGRLKARIADRLLSHREIVEEDSPLLTCALDAARGHSAWRMAWGWLLRPLLALQTTALRWLDRGQTAELYPLPPPPVIGAGAGKPGGASPDARRNRRAAR